MMKKGIMLVLYFVLSHASYLYGQDLPKASYEINNGEVIFKFHKSCINSTDAECGALADFEHLDLKKAIASNDFTACREDGWIVKDLGKGMFEMRKSLDFYKEKLDYGDVFMIDAQYWKIPYSQTEIQKGKKEVFDLKKSVKVSSNGNAIFWLKGHLDAKEVILTGSFVDWREHDIKMQKIGSQGWRIKMDIPPGIYEYKFIVDGEWKQDPDNKSTVINQYRTLNSILSIGKQVTFTLKGHNSAKKAILSGSFNNWNEEAMKMIKTREGWKYTLELPPGKHFYKFIVDGEWMLDPENILQERFKDSVTNSVLVIKM